MSLVDELIKEWKSIIESLEVDGYKRQVESVNLIYMSGDPNCFPGVDSLYNRLCYKVNFNFPLQSEEYFREDQRFMLWNWELTKIFTQICKDGTSFNNGSVKPGSSTSEYSFKNSKVDYFQNQGYRIIIQFYPQGFISQLRNKKLELLGI